MARITVEDCEEVVANKFDLVVLAAQRTRQIINGDPITLENKDEKKPVIALREIAARSISVDMLKECSIRNFRTFTAEEDMDEDIEDLPEEDTYNPYIGINSVSEIT
ncbi:MAG: DNA-directed RNA polymerase subunit omega [Holosporaceae bacterium]|jgi:DNA-directed RNA polymerase subunit omega|nr:DNA-directed RNA polymerase subunit omega [Holosporaceae bacterium]